MSAPPTIDLILAARARAMQVDCEPDKLYLAKAEKEQLEDWMSRRMAVVTPYVTTKFLGMDVCLAEGIEPCVLRSDSPHYRFPL